MTPELLMAITAAKGLPMPLLPGGGRPAWTAAECAIACKHIEQRYFYALRYVYAMDDSVRQPLQVDLLDFALSERDRLNLPLRIPTFAGVRPYTPNLVQMLLMEWRQPWRFVRQEASDPNMRRIVMNVSEPVWRTRLSDLYGRIDGEFQEWIFTGIGVMRPRLRAEVA